ncbi:MAG TPA: ATP-binding protein, partial [Acidobacteriota bacterium]|nr:ATP-binding protein [Acidobacteriota bacterium]
LRMAGTSLDITERKTLEVQLRQAQKMEAIGRLAGSIAHDFNNLLTVMMGLTNVLQQRLPQDHVCVPYVDQLRKVSERGAALTQQLLIFSRKQVVKLEPTQLNAAIGELQTMLGRLIGENIELAVVLDPDLGLTNADSGQLEQVILNLVINARDAMPNGGHLVIKTINCDVDEDFTQWHPEVKPGRYVVLSIADDGLGMDDQTKSCIFEPFFTTKTPEKGTGLGLAIVYGIVKQSGGHILVDSQVGQGTRFSLYFPRLQTGKLPETNQSPEPVHQKGDETILVAEDDTDIRELIHEFLTEAGYRVITASDGVDALGKVAEYQEKIHLLVTDVRMPRMDGAELVQKLLLHNADLKVLYISGYADLPALKKNDRGNHVLLQKPFHPGTLLGKIQEILRKA